VTGAVLVLVTVLSWASAASAAPPSAVAQYVETLPTASGQTAAGGKTLPLSSAAQAAMSKAGKFAPFLNQLVTNGAYGAPTQLLPPAAAKPSSALSAGITAIGSSASMLALLGVLVVTTLLMFYYWLDGQRRKAAAYVQWRTEP
jgi:hypothetical protein